jgi:uroporphyrinogen decarboxylase
MTNRERLFATVAGNTPDRGLFWPERYWDATQARWREEGMPDGHDFGYDPVRQMDGFGVNINYAPEWETGIIADEGDHDLIRNMYGIVQRVPKETINRNVVQYVSFPVSGRDDWEALKPRLAADAPGRFPDDWTQRARSINERDEIVVWGGQHLCGFFSFVRELVGDEEVMYLFYDDPGMVHDMMDFQVQRLCGLLDRAVEHLRVDCVFIWEDMCYKNGPLISPAHFREFLLEPYQRYIDRIRSHGIRVVDVDSDGDVTELIPLWIEAGVDMLHPFEVQAGMDVVEIGRQYGKAVTLRGGIDKRQLALDRAAIDREIERIRPAYESGHYIPVADHSIPPDVPFDNFCYYLDRRRELVGA